MSMGLLESIDQQTRLAGHNRLALLLFRLGGRPLFGINVFKVQEVLPRPTITRFPHAHAHVAGVAPVRGQAIPVLDLGRAIGGAPAAEGGYVIVTEYNRSVQGFLVGAVERIINVGVETVQPPPSSGGAGRGFLTAIARHGAALVQIIDVERVLADVTGGPRDVSAQIVERARRRGVPARILVTDDSRVARAQVERILSQLGVECVFARDGREALGYLQALAGDGRPVTEQLAMVISDIEMPDMDGYALTTEIRRDPRLRGLHVLLHTSLSGVFNHAMVEKVGANRFIAKFDPDELAAAILERLEQ